MPFWPVSTEAARTNDMGCKFHVGDIRNLNLDWFDNTTTFHVLEHLHELLEFVKRRKNSLKHDGCFFAVPNDLGTPRAPWQICSKPIRLTNEQEIHLSHFTPRSLSSLIERCGFRILDLALDPYWDVAGWKEPLRFALLKPLYRLTRVNLYPAIWVTTIT